MRLGRVRGVEEGRAHIKTRLVSWSHVSDSSVATLLQDYPLASRPAAAGDVPARAPSALLLLDILAAAPSRMVGRHFSFLAAASMLTSTSYFYERGTRGTVDVVPFVPVHCGSSLIG